ncbi:hypothetical protein AVEN_95139-1 [Araneus ventricosus]|uniref:Uncharacterized protein n=1 Tax=Araneus ventricosus TaxID=182803 RepID=A0A4Y2KB08_ARAVE|nr:hypothetical protein AVEN_95139-1 [Araneus ventricosus]
MARFLRPVPVREKKTDPSRTEQSRDSVHPPSPDSAKSSQSHFLVGGKVNLLGSFHNESISGFATSPLRRYLWCSSISVVILLDGLVFRKDWTNDSSFIHHHYE